MSLQQNTTPGGTHNQTELKGYCGAKSTLSLSLIKVAAHLTSYFFYAYLETVTE